MGRKDRKGKADLLKTNNRTSTVGTKMNKTRPSLISVSSQTNLVYGHKQNN